MATLADDDARKLIVVLRKATGAALEIVDSSGTTYAATLIADGPFARARLDRRLAAPAPLALRLTVAQGLPKGQKMDFVVEKAAELGVVRIVPFASQRSVGGAERAGKLERWRRIAKAAAQQCGRADVPDVEAPCGFEDLLGTLGRYDAAFVPWELEGGGPLRERLPSLLDGVREALVVIGPEGGLASAEVEGARARGAHPISLGSRIFRTETAALVACTALLYAAGDI